MREPNAKPNFPLTFALMLVATPLVRSHPLAALWTAPCILLASVVITWGAEAAQFFVAQGFALAILAWMQTLPEFAVEAVLAWKQQTNLLLAGLTGALRLLTGVAWPMIYATAAVMHRKRTGHPLRCISLKSHQSVEVVGLLAPLLYAIVIWWKRTLHVYDACILVVIYAAYLALLTKLPPEREEGMDNLEAVPKRIVRAPRRWRMVAIAACFLGGGILIYFTADPFLQSLLALAVFWGVPSFAAIQWLAPVISEFPELLSTFYFARQEDKASVALMNITSSNINQWTLLVAILPVVYSLSRHAAIPILLDAKQQAELALTIAQGFAGLIFLINMKFAWWEALAMFVLFAAQLVLPGLRDWITLVFWGWVAIEIAAMLVRWQKPTAWTSFSRTWREHVRT